MRKKDEERKIIDIRKLEIFITENIVQECTKSLRLFSFVETDILVL